MHKSLYILFVLALLPYQAFAASMVNGKAVVSFESSLFSSGPAQEQKTEALKQAKRQAWEKYIQGFSPAKLKLYRKLESSILEDLDNYFLKVNVIDEKVDDDKNQYTVIVRATINEARLQTLFAKVSSGDKVSASLFSFIFVARAQNSVTSYDKTRVKSHIKDATQSVTSSSTELVEDKVEYRILSADSIDTAMNQVLSSSGFEVVKYDDVVSECGGVEPGDIRNTFTVNNNITRVQRKSAIQAAKACDVSYFAVGTLDVVLADTDPVSGNQRVFVSVKSQVWNIKDRLPKQISSVGPVQYQGIGPNNLVAQNNALTMATESVAKEIINQLNAKGLR